MFAKPDLTSEVEQILTQNGVQYDHVRVSRGRLYVHLKSKAESFHVCELLSRLDGRFRPELAFDTVVALREVDNEEALISQGENASAVGLEVDKYKGASAEEGELEDQALPRLDLCLLFGALPPIAAGVYASSASSGALALLLWILSSGLIVFGFGLVLRARYTAGDTVDVGRFEQALIGPYRWLWPVASVGLSLLSSVAAFLILS